MHQQRLPLPAHRPHRPNAHWLYLHNALDWSQVASVPITTYRVMVVTCLAERPAEGYGGGDAFLLYCAIIHLFCVVGPKE
jgi:hypothetical protein